MRSHIGSPKAMRPVDPRRGPGGLHSVAKQASFSVAFWSNFGGFGRLKSMPKFDFRALFFDVIFERNFTSKFGSCLKAQNQKIAIFYWKNNGFHEISFFDKDPKNNKFSFHFRKPKRRKFQ